LYEKRDNMSPQATEQTGVDKKRSRLLFGRLPVRTSKAKPATLPEIPFQVPGPIRGNFYISLTKPFQSALYRSSRDFKFYCLQRRKKKHTGIQLQRNQPGKTRRLAWKLQEPIWLLENLRAERGYEVPVALCVKFHLWQTSKLVSGGYVYNDGTSDGWPASGGRIPCTYCDADHRLTSRLYSSQPHLIRNLSYYTSRLNSFQFVSRPIWWVQSHNQQRWSLPFYVIFHNFMYHITSRGN